MPVEEEGEHQGEEDDQQHDDDLQQAEVHRDAPQVQGKDAVGDDVQHGLGLRAEDDLRQVLDQHGEADGAQKGNVPRRVEEALIAELVHRDAQHKGASEGHEKPQQNVVAARQEDVEGTIGADHHDFAVSEGDHAHDAHDGRVTDGHQRVDRALTDAVDELVEDIFHNVSSAGSLIRTEKGGALKPRPLRQPGKRLLCFRFFSDYSLTKSKPLSTTHLPFSVPQIM